jgi:hypothetical protein
MAENTLEAPPAERTGNRYAAALRHRDLRTLVLAFVVDGAASWSYNVVLIAYVFERTHSASWITALVTVRWVVGVALGGYGGVLAARCCSPALSRRRESRSASPLSSPSTHRCGCCSSPAAP